MDTPVRYRLLRDGVSWDTTSRSALSVREDGAIGLADLPGPSDREGFVRPAPYDAVASGIAVDFCGRILLSDSKASALLFLVPSCSFRYALDMAETPGTHTQAIASPTGLAAVHDILY